MKKTIAQNLVNPFLIIAVAVMFRFIPHPPNVAPIAAMALFGGVYLNKRYALIAPIIAMVISDLFLGFHLTVPFVYGSLVLTGCIGLLLKKHKNAFLIIGASLASSIIFYLITNFGVWVMYDFYPKTISGLLESYVSGIPFFRNTVFGDLFFTGVFFGGYEFILRIHKKILPVKSM